MSIEYNELFQYNNGKLYNKTDRSKSSKKGDEVGSLLKSGYKSTTIKQKRFYIHRIIYKLFNKDFDINNIKHQIDHINRDKQDNRIENLRLVTHYENQFNRSNTKGYTKQRNKFIVNIYVNKKRYYIGSYDTEVEASEAYNNFKSKLI